MTADHADDEQDRASSENLQETFGPPSATLPTRVLDLVITTTDRSHEAPEGEYERNPPATQDGPIDLGFGVRLEELRREDAELVLNACSPRGHFFIPVRQFGQRYTYVFDRATDEATATSTDFDPEQRLNAAIQLSRLVRENSDSMQYGARLVMYEDGSKMVIPFPDFELGRAYALVRGRDWMTRDEADQLRTLLDSYWEVSNGLPPRIKRATRRCLHIATERYVDDRVTEATIALESLVSTGAARAATQFVDRVVALGTEFEIDGASRSWANRMYTARSQGVHGASIQLFAKAAPQRTNALDQVIRLEDLLRHTIRRILEDSEFRARFASDEAVSDWLPVLETPEVAPSGCRVIERARRIIKRQ